MKSFRLLGLALVVLLALGAYLLVDGSGSTDTATDPAARSSATAQAPEPSPSASDDLGASADAQPEPDPTDDADGVEDGSEDDSEWEVDTESGLPIIDVADLPAQARETIELIDAGGPYPYDKDGSTFRNDEGLLPDRESGYYAEYTVPNPGEGDRGPRRIVVGGDGEMYWTADHYQSFELIRR